MEGIYQAMIKIYLGKDQTGLVCWCGARVESGEGKVGGEGFNGNEEQNRQFLEEEERFEGRTQKHVYG